jgi:hypothetical protein
MVSALPKERRIETGEHAALLADLESRRPVLLATLAGVAGDAGIPRFEFVRMASGLDVKRVFIRDVTQSWYQGSMRGVGRGPGGVANTLQEIVVREGIERSVLVGNSMGGFAALIVGSLMGADEVHAFSPTTFIGPFGRLRHGDARWRRHILRAYKRSLFLPKYFDVMPILARYDGPTRFHVHYSTEDALDVVHAERLAGIPRVELRTYEHGGHELVMQLRDSGRLAAILRSSLFSEAAEPTAEVERGGDAPQGPEARNEGAA